MRRLKTGFVFLLMMPGLFHSASGRTPVHGVVQVYDIYEIVLNASGSYDNPYTGVTCWVQLKGPDFDKRIYVFWDGGQTFRVRVVATRPGEWSWISGSNQPDDNGLNGRMGNFTAKGWSVSITAHKFRKNENSTTLFCASDLFRYHCV